METIRILLADDHFLLCEGTGHILEQFANFKVVGQANDGQSALELAERLRPDIAILDVRMPKLNGIEVVRRMKQCSPNTKTLVLTAYDDDDFIMASMEAGASGYLLKTVRPSQLAEVVERICQGDTVLDPVVTEKVARLWSKQKEQDRNSLLESLSLREREVLELAANGLRNKDIADKLGISNRTVEGHFNSIFAKLQVSSRLEAVLHVVSRHDATAGGKDNP